LCTMSTSRPVLREGEWACVDARCSYINSIQYSSCQACGRRKPRGKGTVGQAIGKDAAEKSKGLFEAEDWCCSKCGNINWARRATCNICNAKKFAEVEARTGYGGGYMDRQQVEYIPRNESEEEYDEVLNHIWLLKGKRKRMNEKHDSGYENLDEKKGKMEKNDKERPEEEYTNKGYEIEREEEEEEKEEEEEEEEDDDDEDGDLSKYQLGQGDFEKPLSKRKGRRRSSKRKRRESSGSEDRSASPSRSRSSSYSSSTRDGSSGSDKSCSRSSGSNRSSSVSSRRSSSSSSRSRGRPSSRRYSNPSGKHRGYLHRRKEKYRSTSTSDLVSVANLHIQVRLVEIRTVTVDIDDIGDAENGI
ncbi:Zinc finger Ran-binding domain-containing protein 2, partial [Trichinella pseudospiralis]